MIVLDSQFGRFLVPYNKYTFWFTNLVYLGAALAIGYFMTPFSGFGLSISQEIQQIGVGVIASMILVQFADMYIE